MIAIAKEYERREDGVERVVAWERSYEGATLCKREENGYDDSDFYAVVWDEKEQRLKKVYYASTRYYSYYDHAIVDATPEVKEKATRWLREWCLEFCRGLAEQSTQAIEKGRRVRVTSGRKLPIGTEGVVFWRGVDRFASNRWHTKYRVGIELDNGERVFLDEGRVAVADPEQYRPSEEELVQKAEAMCARLVESEAWYVPFTKYPAI